MPSINVPGTGTTIPGLTNGVQYDVSVAAYAGATTTSSINQIGEPAEAGDYPSAPTSFVPANGPGQVSATWGVPVSDGSSPVTSYNAVLMIGEVRQDITGISPTARTVTFTGLNNGSAYTLAISAVNAAGEGPEVSATVTPGSAPGAPTALVVTPGNTNLIWAWTAPLNNGGSAVTGYAVTMTGSDSSNRSTTTSSPTVTFTGLTNGVVYSVSIKAVNATSQSAALIGTATPDTTPDPPQPPTNLVVTKTATGELTLAWTAPTNNGGSAVTGYKISYSSPGVAAIEVTSTTPTKVLTGLTNGTVYTLSVKAVNAIGDSLTALTGTGTPSAVVVTPPGVPTSLVPTAGNGTATVTWGLPATGSAPTSYTAVLTATGVTQTIPTTARTATFSGLTNGVTYTISVTATNSAGTSSAATTTVTPAAPSIPPGSPVQLAVSPGNGFIGVQWAAPADPGTSAIQGYVVTASAPNVPGDSETVPATTLGTVMTGLTNGVIYTVTVTAFSTAGSSQPVTTTSKPFVAGAVVPSIPQNLIVTPGVRQLGVAWAAPASDGGDAITAYRVTLYSGTRVLSSTDVDDAILTATLTGLSSTIPYRVTVAAINSVGVGIEASQSAQPVEAQSTPGPVIGAAGTVLSTTSVELTWSEPTSAGTPDNYVISSVPLTPIKTVSASTLSTTITGLRANTTYVFTIVATNEFGPSSISNVTLTTLARDPIIIIPLPIPNPYAFPQPSATDRTPRIFRPQNFGKTIDEVPVGE